jgi:hypothetical protein
MDSVCNIELIKDGDEFVARIYFFDGTIREYRHKKLEEAFTEMVIAVQNELDE